MTKKRHQVIPRTMCFVFNKDKVLLLKANSTKDWDGTYDPLGGHIEKGESILENAVREIEEESGLKVKDTKLRGIVHVSGFFDKEIMLFVTSSTTNETVVVSNHEGDLEWVAIENLDKINAFEDLKPILKHVLDMSSDEIFFGVSQWDGKDSLQSLDIKINKLGLS